MNLAVIDLDICSDITIDFVSRRDSGEVIRSTFIFIGERESFAQPTKNRCDIIGYSNSNCLGRFVAAFVGSFQDYVVLSRCAEQVTGISSSSTCSCRSGRGLACCRRCNCLC